METKRRGRPTLPRDASGNIIRDGLPQTQPVVGDVLDTFSSINDFIERVEAMPLACEENRGELEAQLIRKESSFWALPKPVGQSYVKALIRNGWNDGATRLFEMAKQIKAPTVQTIKRKMIWGDEGREIDLDSYLARDTERLWTDYTKIRKNSGGRVVKISANIAAPGFTSGDAFFWPGAAATVLTDLLTQAGYLTEVNLHLVTTNSRDNDRKHTAIIRVKDAEQPLSVVSLASTLCFAGFFRTIGFNWLCKTYKKGCGSGLGTVVRGLTSENPSEIFINFSDVTSEKEAIDWIANKIAALEA